MNVIDAFLARHDPGAAEAFAAVGLYFKEKSLNHFKVTIEGLASGRMWTDAQSDVESLFGATWYYAAVGIDDAGAYEWLGDAIRAAFALANAFHQSREK